MQIFFQPIQNINLGGKLAKSQYQYTLQSNDTEALYRIAPELRDKIAKLPGLLDVTTDLYIKNPQVTVEVDREKSAVYGVSIDQVRQELYNAFGSRQVATIYTPANDYQVILETKPEFQQSPNDLNRIYMKTTNGTTVPLSAVTHFVRTVGPAAGQPPGPAAGGDHLVQSHARHVARPGGRRHHQAGARRAAARHHHHRLPGHRAGVPGFIARAGHSDPGRDLRRLCGARHPVRKLHPSDHHHLRPAVGRHRRDPHA